MTTKTATPKPIAKPGYIFTNDLKKGATLRLRNGWTAILEDNMKGNIRVATVTGFVTEMGSIYMSDVTLARPTVNDPWMRIELTKAQLKFRQMQW